MLLRVLSVRLLAWPVLPSIPFGFWCNAQHHQCSSIQQCCQRSSTENGSRGSLKSAHIDAVASSSAVNAPAWKMEADVA
eukprot:2560030-Rhodomonas_salina.1